MTVFDANGQVELDSADTMFAVLKELYEAQPTAWRGFIHANETTTDPGWSLELNPTPDRPDRPGISAFIGDHIQKVAPFGIIMKITAADYAEWEAAQ